MLIVSKASAGSGKTFALALIYIQFMLKSLREQGVPDPYKHILAVTFTKKATAEMKQRIVEELYLLAQNPAESRYTDYLIGVRSLHDEGAAVHRNLTEAQRQTEIQKLSQDARLLLGNLLQDYPSFQVSTIDSFFQQVIRNFASELGLNTNYNVSLDQGQIISEGIDRLFFDINDGAADLEMAFSNLLNYAANNINNGRDWDPKKSLKTFAEQIYREDVQRHKDALKKMNNPALLNKVHDALSAFCKKAEQEYGVTKNGTLSAKAPDDIKRKHCSAVLTLKHFDDISMLAAIEEKIDEKNRLDGRIPIAETNMLLNRIINGAEAPFIYEKTGTRLRHFLIDEFQDTSRLQWENFRPLIAESCSNSNDNLLVGDVKQSIYRWRNSDMTILQNIDSEPLFSNGLEYPKSHNFRTSQIIVEANNLLFRRYADSLASCADKSAALAPDAGKAYERLEQTATRKGAPGLFRIEWWQGSKQEFAEKAVERTIQTIRELLQTGRVKHLSEIALLLRLNKEAATITDSLIAAGIAVQSPEGLYITNHKAVQCLIAMLRCITDPCDRISAAMAESVLQTTAADMKEWLTTAQGMAYHSDLFTLARNLIDTFSLSTLPDADAYLTTFLDVVYEYCIKKNADISGFLEYWDTKKKTPPCIPASQAPDAVQISTIHKAKGLQFPVVIIPFLNWALGPNQKTRDTVLWCETTDMPEPFNLLPVIPVHAVKDAEKSYFQHAYQKEIQQEYIDALNLCYVAFTRPKHTIIAFAPQEQSVRADKNVGQWLYRLMQDKITTVDSDDAGSCEVWQESNGLMPETEEEKPAGIRTVKYVSVPENGRLKLRSHSLDDEESNLVFGTHMHELLSSIKTEDDAEAALDAYAASGAIRQEDKPKMQTALDALFDLVRKKGHADWFSDKYEVRNECSILSADNDSKRADRIMIDGTHAVIIDYKFGMPDNANNRQVQRYMERLRDMGYSVEGYLVYAGQGHIDDVLIDKHYD